MKFVENSVNVKIAHKNHKVCATYAPIKQSCSKKCALQDKVCYAQTSYVGIINARLQKAAEGLSPDQIARIEAKAIRESFKGGKIPQDGYSGGRDLRIHVSGDCRTSRGAGILARAALQFVERGGGSVWTYTHSRQIPRAIWGEAVSILASVDNISQVDEATKSGYAPAIVVETFPKKKRFKLDGSDALLIPCPAQTRDKTCVECRLCLNADRLFSKNMGIAFESHGSRKRNIKKLKVLK